MYHVLFNTIQKHLLILKNVAGAYHLSNESDNAWCGGNAEKTTHPLYAIKKYFTQKMIWLKEKEESNKIHDGKRLQNDLRKEACNATTRAP